MIAITDQKARMFDLVTTVCELVRDGRRDIVGVSDVLQIIKENSNFALRLLGRVELWRTFTVGGVTKDELLRQLITAGIEISQWARELMESDKFVTSTAPYDVAFGRIKVSKLGFTEMPTTLQLLYRIREVGALCQPEDAVYLRLAFKDQPNSDIFCCAMEPIANLYGVLCVFFVGRSGGGQRWLFADGAHPDGRWGLVASVVFRLRPQ